MNGGTGTGLLTVTGGTATFNGDGDDRCADASGGELNGSGTLTVTGTALLTGGTQSGSGTTNVQGGATFSNGSRRAIWARWWADAAAGRHQHGDERDERRHVRSI